MCWNGMVENVLSEAGYITVIEWNSDYHILSMQWSADEGETLYVNSIQTSVLNNRMKGDTNDSKTIEMRRISRIVYRNSDDGETVLREAKDAAASPE